jgi:uncharacterized lipoprotein YmbA
MTSFTRLSARDALWGGFGLAAALATLACGSAPPRVHHYELVVPAPTHPRTRASNLTLAIEPLRVDAAYDTERMVYRLSPYRVDYYEYHRWAAHPGLHVGDYLRKAYAATGLFRDVVIEPTQPSYFVLGGRVTAIEEIDATDASWIGRIAVELWLRERASGTRLWSAAYDRRAPMPERSPEGLARALSGALHEVALESSKAVAAVLVEAERKGQ